MSATKEHRKSVAFSEGATIVDADGEVSQEKVNGVAKVPSAESHSTGLLLHYFRIAFKD